MLSSSSQAQMLQPTMKIMPFDGASGDSQQYYFLDNFYANGWENKAQEVTAQNIADSTIFTTFLDSQIQQQPPPKLEDFLGNDSSLVRYSDSQTETQDSSLTHLYDQGGSAYFHDHNDLKTLGSTESGTELGFSQCPNGALSLGVRARARARGSEKALVSVDSESCKKISDTFGQRTSIYRGVTRLTAMEFKPPPPAEEKLHIVMFPWLAFGHMIPFLELSRLIAQKGHKISFVSTPKNIDRLPKLPPNLSPLVKFVKIPLPHTENLPEAAEATIDVTYDEAKYLKFAYDGLQKTHLSLKIPCAYFNILNAAFIGFLGPVPIMMGGEDYRTKPEDFTVPPKWVPFESTVAFRIFEILRIFGDSVVGDDENVSDLYRIGATIKGIFTGNPLFPVGLLPAADDGGENGGGWSVMKEWLDKQGKESVVYIAFGSEAELSQEELTEVALGLELSELPFFWVLRKRSNEIKLPDGFEERTKGRGLVWTSWAPQPRILSHDSGINARVLEEKKMGYEIPRDERVGSFTRNLVAESIRLVMVEEAGKIYRNSVKDMSRLFGDRDRQDKYVDNLLGHLHSHSRLKNERVQKIIN
ncbi:UDP-Glycosyltransferase superfamily protein [Actinidia rufa]|uniref:UDP-Glycosyltransferase superfamily protein n=1 Tax=Actinidia rufa TaxID=165716 RepID=A0A7J0F5X3_9ERIC|nr:UDP-Glycosyltransferase superfamily protein [Actinidia rufa]